MNTAVDAYLARAKQWQEEMEMLRSIALECGLTEQLKWGKPCYAWEDHNIVIIQGFKAYCALLFFKGVLLKDPKNVLVKTGENTQVGRQVRVGDVREVTKLKSTLKAYIKEAIALEKAGAKVAVKKKADVVWPDELKQKFTEKPALKKAFEQLTPGRQRAYIIFFSSPKQTSTRLSRIEKCAPRIQDGKGLNDR